MRLDLCCAAGAVCTALVPTFILSIIYLIYTATVVAATAIVDPSVNGTDIGLPTIGEPFASYELINGVLNLFAAGTLVLAFLLAAVFMWSKDRELSSEEDPSPRAWTIWTCVTATFMLYAIIVGIMHLIFGIWYSVEMEKLAVPGAWLWFLGPVRLVTGIVQLLIGGVVLPCWLYPQYTGGVTKGVQRLTKASAGHYDPVETDAALFGSAAAADAAPAYSAAPSLAGVNTHQRMVAAAARGSASVAGGGGGGGGGGGTMQAALFDTGSA